MYTPKTLCYSVSHEIRVFHNKLNLHRVSGDQDGSPFSGEESTAGCCWGSRYFDLFSDALQILHREIDHWGGAKPPSFQGGILHSCSHHLFGGRAAWRTPFWMLFPIATGEQ